MLHLMVAEPNAEYNSIEARTRGIDEAPDDTIGAIQRKAEQFHRLVVSSEYRHRQQIADAWCAAFVWEKQANTPFEPITTDTIRRLEADAAALTPPQRTEVDRLSDKYQFFHWHLAFPEVFAAGGFDCVLGNPPWEHTELKEKEWFAERRLDIANARTGAERKRMIETLKQEDPPLYAAFADSLREHDGASHFLGNSGRYPFCGRGRINVYTVFAEGMRTLLNDRGRVGCVLPTGIATDDTTKFFFQDVADKKSLVSLFDFENRRGLFPAVDSRMKFCLFTSGRGLHPTTETAEFVFFAHGVEDLRDTERRFTLSAEDIALLNPNTRTCPIFRSRRDAELTKAIYRRVPVLIREAQGDRPEENPWGLSIRRVFNMGIPEVVDLCLEDPSVDEQADLYPMYEAKLVHQYDHRFASYSGDDAIDLTAMTKLDPAKSARSRFWIQRSEVCQKLAPLWDRRWLLVWRDICRNTDERTVIAAVLPFAGTDFTLRCGLPSHEEVCTRAQLIANWNAFAFDYCTRQLMGGTHLSDFITRQLAVFPPATSTQSCRWTDDSVTLRDWLLARVLELSYTAWDLRPFAQDCGWSGPPFRWNEERRFLLRCELDAAFFHLYLPAEENGDWRRAEGETAEDLARLKTSFATPRDAVAYIMDTFPIVRRKDEKKYDHDYRTKRVILEIYDAMQESIRTGQPYQTRLDPPPADAACCHPKLKLGILAYGSLISDPGVEIASKIRMRVKTTTPFPVEYGRYSGKTRGGAPTLVRHEAGAAVSAEILMLDDAVSIEEATDMLWRRECRQIDSDEKYVEGTTPNSVLVREITDNTCVNSVLYTDFLPAGKIPTPSAADLADLASRALESVKKAEASKDGITYLIAAIAAGIQTPLTEAYRQAILHQSGTQSLDGARMRAAAT